MKWWKIPPQDAPPADEGTMQAWRRKRCAIMRFCRARTGGCRTAPETRAGRLLVAAAFVPVIAAKFLNTACQTCPHWGISASPRKTSAAASPAGAAGIPSPICDDLYQSVYII